MHCPEGGLRGRMRVWLCLGAGACDKAMPTAAASTAVATAATTAAAAAARNFNCPRGRERATGQGLNLGRCEVVLCIVSKLFFLSGCRAPPPRLSLPELLLQRLLLHLNLKFQHLALDELLAKFGICARAGRRRRRRRRR